MKKKKGFIIDKISEDTFYENILLGLPRFLKKSQFISNIKCDRLSPCPISLIRSWESRNIPLPPDIRNFFLSTNGFNFSYKFQYSSPGDESIQITAKIAIKPLETIAKVDNGQISTMTEQGPKYLNPQSNVFVISDIDESNCVVMAQFGPKVPPNYWLYSKGKDFYFLCNDFQTYFKMAVAHLGVSGWQMCACNGTYSEWTTEMYQILAPGIILNSKAAHQDVNKRNFLNCSIFDVELNEGEKQEIGDVAKKQSDVKCEPIKPSALSTLKRAVKSRRK